MPKRLHVVDLNRKQIQAITHHILLATSPRALCGEEPVDVESIFELYIPKKFKIATEYQDLSRLGPNVLGFTDAKSKMSLVDLNLYSSDLPVGRRRSRTTTGHEIGHCVIHVPVLAAFSSSCRDESELSLYRREASKLQPWQEPEWQAWEFCRNLLMPVELVKRYVAEGKTPREMSQLFDVNKCFVDSWLRKLGLLNTRPF